MAKINALIMTKTAAKPIPFGVAHTRMAHKGYPREAPHPSPAPLCEESAPAIMTETPADYSNAGLSNGTQT